MLAALQPIKAFKCTYEDCQASFDTETAMINHKKHSAEHDYCSKCNEDFDSYDDLAQHKAFRPDKHNKACRVCGEEFKSTAGLRRHIELNHKVDQKLPCLGCQEEFYRASLLVEHLEFGKCDVITPQQFQGHIVHKHLVTQLLKGGAAYDRFMQKIAKFDATQDIEEEGGIDIDNMLDDEDDEDEAREIKYEAIQPESAPEEHIPYTGPYPPLPSKAKTATAAADMTSSLDRMSLNGASESATAVGSADEDMSGTTKALISTRQPKPWSGRSGKELFPNAKPTPPPSEFSISYHDEQMQQEHGINIMDTRFWDPLSNDWNPERFYDGVVQKYYCPFICEQTFDEAQEMNKHIITEHRITRMKCPSCLKYFQSVTALMCHCESRGAKCQINKADDYNIFLDKLTGGFLSVKEQVRPDHLHNPTVTIENPDTKKLEQYTPPTASYLQYTSSKPVDWKDPKKVAAQIGGGGASQVFKYRGGLSRW